MKTILVAAALAVGVAGWAGASSAMPAATGHAVHAVVADKTMKQDVAKKKKRASKKMKTTTPS